MTIIIINYNIVVGIISDEQGLTKITMIMMHDDDDDYDDDDDHNDHDDD